MKKEMLLLPQQKKESAALLVFQAVLFVEVNHGRQFNPAFALLGCFGCFSVTLIRLSRIWRYYSAEMYPMRPTNVTRTLLLAQCLKRSITEGNVRRTSSLLVVFVVWSALTLITVSRIGGYIHKFKKCICWRCRVRPRNDKMRWHTADTTQRCVPIIIISAYHHRTWFYIVFSVPALYSSCSQNMTSAGACGHHGYLMDVTWQQDRCWFKYDTEWWRSNK